MKLGVLYCDSGTNKVFQKKKKKQSALPNLKVESYKLKKYR